MRQGTFNMCGLATGSPVRGLGTAVHWLRMVLVQLQEFEVGL